MKRTATLVMVSILMVVCSLGAKKKNNNPPTDSTQSSNTGEIKKGMTLAEAEQIAGAAATKVGGPRGSTQIYRLMVKEGPASGNTGPVAVMYMLNVQNGIITFVKK